MWMIRLSHTLTSPLWISLFSFEFAVFGDAFVFNSDISKWQVSKVWHMGSSTWQYPSRTCGVSSLADLLLTVDSHPFHRRTPRGISLTPDSLSIFQYQSNQSYKRTFLRRTLFFLNDDKRNTWTWVAWPTHQKWEDYRLAQTFGCVQHGQDMLCSLNDMLDKSHHHAS